MISIAITICRCTGKRLFDLLITLPALILLSPPLGILALLVRVKLGSPVLFRQQRPGLHGEPFTLVKFRTMTDARDAQGNLLPDAQRLTRFGRFLRSSSLDELPELWNVLKGEMRLALSIVEPIVLSSRLVIQATISYNTLIIVQALHEWG